MREVLPLNTIAYRFYRFRIDIFSKDSAARPDSPGCSDCQPAASRSNIRNRGPGMHTEKRKDALGLEPCIAFRIFKNRQIARVGRARWMGW